ncbi:hypothetical protein LINGRAHAP2_LOCUS2290 [Linum grandiflorum]
MASKRSFKQLSSSPVLLLSTTWISRSEISPLT